MQGVARRLSAATQAWARLAQHVRVSVTHDLRRRPWTARLLRLPGDIERLTGLRLNAVAALGVAALLWGLGRLVAGRPLYLLAYGTVVVVALSWLVPRRGLRLRAARRYAARRLREGEALDVAVTLSARRSLATVVVEERVPEVLGQTVKLAVAHIPRGDSEHEYQLQCWRRGAFLVGPMVARFGDPVGLVSREQVLAEPFEVLVHPTLGVVDDRPQTRRFEDPPQRPRVSKPWPTGLDFQGMRERSDGDDMRRIVWRVVARTGRLMVREAEQGITDRVTLVLNTWSEAYPQEEYSAGFEAAVRVVASLGVHHLGEGFLVAAEAGAGLLTPRPLRGPTARIALLDALARVERGADSLSVAITRLSRRARGNSHYVVVTPRLDRAEAAHLRPIVDAGASVLAVIVKYGDRCEEAAHNAVAVGCQVVEAPVGTVPGGRLLIELGAHRQRMSA